MALAAYAGSAIAKSNPMKTGINATKLAIAAFIVPYIFAYNPSMLFVGNVEWYDVLLISVTALLGLFGIAAALNGHLYRKIPMVLRLALVAGGLGMMIPGLTSDLIGFGRCCRYCRIPVYLRQKASRIRCVNSFSLILL